MNQTSNDGRVAVDEAFAAEAIDAAEAARSGVLRKLSWEHPNWIRLVSSMVNMEQGLTATTTCLHSAAAAGHAATVHSLVTEAACDILARNALGQFAWDVEANDQCTSVTGFTRSFAADTTKYNTNKYQGSRPLVNVGRHRLSINRSPDSRHVERT